MQLSRRGFFSGLAALVAAPAIVRVESLMKLAPTEVLRPTLREISEYLPLETGEITHIDVLYGAVSVRPEWTVLATPKILTLDSFSERIIAPMAQKLADQVAKSILDPPKLYQTPRMVGLSALLTEARATASSE